MEYSFITFDSAFAFQVLLFSYQKPPLCVKLSDNKFVWIEWPLCNKRSETIHNSSHCFFFLLFLFLLLFFVSPFFPLKFSFVWHLFIAYLVRKFLLMFCIQKCTCGHYYSSLFRIQAVSLELFSNKRTHKLVNRV